MGKEYMSSSNAVIPIILVLSFLSTIGVIYGTLELSDDERNAWEVLKDLLSGKISLQDIWRVLSGRNAEAKAAGPCQGVDQNGVYEYDKDGKCIKLGCKLGYYEQDNMCIERRNFSGEVFSGQTSADCELDPDVPYTYGQCEDQVSGEPLTGDTFSCGKGIRLKSPNVSIPQIGSGSCPNEEYVDCEVPCPKKCNAPDELWVPDDNAPCMAGTRKLGVPIDIGDGAMVTYCGEGTQIKQLDEGRITSAMMGNMSLQDYKNSINFSECISPTSKPCEVACTNETQPVTCPISSYDPGWLYEGGGDGKVYTKESAESLLRGDINSSQLELEPGVSRQDAIDSGAFNTITGDVDADLIPKGYKIKFKASSEYSTESLRERGCSIFVLEEAQAPRIAADAEYEANLTGTCSDVACGQFKQRNVSYKITTPAWGTGDKDVPSTHPADCKDEATSLPCCVKGNDFHYKSGGCIEGIETFTQDTGECSIKNLNGGVSSYTKDCCTQSGWSPVTGYEGCELVDGSWKRKYTRTVTNGCTGADAEKEEYRDDGDCKYDCAITSISFEDGTVDAYRTYGGMYCGIKSYIREIATMDTREPKGGGATCDNKLEVGDQIVGSYEINASYDVLPSAGMPSFKCGSVRISGQCNGWTGESGYGCQAGDEIPGTDVWWRE